MSRRRCFELPGVHHRAPIPMAAQVGRLLHSSGIPGLDPATGEMPADATVQCDNAFQHMRSLLQQAGATLDDVARITFFIKEEAHRQVVNTLWLKYFPEDGNRPARHILLYEHLRGGMLVQLEFMAECPDAPAA